MRLNFSVLALLLCFAAGCGSASQDDLVFVDDGSAAQTPSGTTSATSDDDIVVPPLPEPTAPVESSGFEVAEQTQGTTAGLSSSSISWFLWKPVSDSDGNVVVLVDPVGVTVVATGSAGAETLRDVGPSNDRGTTARGSVPGCRFGRNVIVEFYDSRGRIVPIVNGNYRVQVPDGCQRAEFRL
ncbi:MAG: hypothetical protein KDD66_01865 [Bdellovibrionales bacterium]|nr:hypothetical protein [Bdellovibrionales bacterium]